MGVPGDERGQSVVVGSLFVFTLLILSFSAYQAFSVPNQNAEVEVNHFEGVEDDFSEFRNSVVNAVGTDDTWSTSFDLGARYPRRIIALNPPPAAGKLETKHAGKVEFASASNVCSSSGDPDPTARSLVYTPNYNEYREPRAASYETRVIAREYDGGSLFEQRLVRDDNIELYLLNGTVSENGLDTHTVEVNASNRHTTELNNPTITIPSRFNATVWENEILADRSDVTVSNAGTDRVELDFDNGSYDVSCAAVGIGGSPEFTPPSNDGGSGNGPAYDIKWTNPDGEPGTESCSATDCTLNETAASLSLTAKTDPTAQGAPVEFSVSDRSVGTVSPETDNTGVNGEVTATLDGESNGTVQVFAFSGGSGDVINITVIEGKTLDKDETIVYKGVNATEGDGGKTVTILPDKVKALGPPDADLTGDGSNDLPYVANNGDLNVTDSDGNTERLVNRADQQAPRNSKTVMSVGSWNGSSTSVFYASKDKKKLVRVDSSGSTVVIKNVNNKGGANAVLGPGDIDGDGTEELLYADGSQQVRYLDQDGSVTKLQNAGAGSNNGIGVGQPPDFDGDGTVRAVIVDGSNNVKIVGQAEPTETFTSTKAKKGPVTTADVDGDSKLEIVYVGYNSGNIKYIDDPLGTPAVKFLNDQDGNIISANGKLGVVS